MVTRNRLHFLARCVSSACLPGVPGRHYGMDWLRIGAFGLLILYHVAEQRPMMGTFLDALGIAHENGLIKEDDVKPDVSKIGSAVSAIGEKFPSEDVGLYLNTLVCQDPETWSALSELAEKYAGPSQP